MLPAEVLTTKFNHEISGLMSAIKIGVEYIHHKNLEIRKQSEKMLVDATSITLKKIAFFKELYGYRDEECIVDIDTIKDLVKGFLIDSKIASKCESKNHDGEVCALSAKLVLCIVTILKRYIGLTNLNIVFQSDYIRLKGIFDGEVKLIKNHLDSIKAQLTHYSGITKESKADRVSVNNTDLHYFRYLVDKINSKNKIKIEQSENFICIKLSL